MHNKIDTSKLDFGLKPSLTARLMRVVGGGVPLTTATVYICLENTGGLSSTSLTVITSSISSELIRRCVHGIFRGFSHRLYTFSSLHMCEMVTTRITTNTTIDQYIREAHIMGGTYIGIISQSVWDFCHAQ